MEKDSKISFYTIELDDHYQGIMKKVASNNKLEEMLNNLS